MSIYRVLPGFREFAVFEKSKRFFILFFGWALQRGGQGPCKGPNMKGKGTPDEHLSSNLFDFTIKYLYFTDTYHLALSKDKQIYNGF